MSLIKRYGGPSKRKGDEEKGEPQSGPSKPLFRKSASIDPPSGSDIERPPSQQSGKGKKKLLPSFFSKVFSGNNGGKGAAEEGNNGKKISSSRSAGGDFMEKRENYASRESLNSVLSSSSFSYVNPKSIGGKKVKGKRIPVDDPTYGSPIASSSSSVGVKQEKKGFSNTIERIGARIGLKMKYNLQSCESLQYIDACDESLPNANMVGCSSASSPPTKPTNNVRVAGNSTGAIKEAKEEAETTKTTVKESDVKESKESQGRASAKINGATDAGQIDPALKFAVIKSSKISVKSHALKYNEEKKKESRVEELAQIPKEKEKPEPIPKSGRDEETSKMIKSPVKVESSAQTVVVKANIHEEKQQQPIPIPLAITKISQSTSTTHLTADKISQPEAKIASTTTTTPSKECKNETKIETKSGSVETKCDATSSKDVEKQVNRDNSHAPVEQDTKREIRSLAKASIEEGPQKSCPKVEAKNVITSDPIPSTSESVMQGNASTPPPPAVASTSKAIHSNTWGNSARRKRKAPQPPMDSNEPLNRFSNGPTNIKSKETTSIVTELSNDVPTSSSPAAALRNFKRIEDSPPPPPSATKVYSGTFEIRPRKKEMAVDAMSCRPTSSFATPSGSNNSNTLFSPHNPRYQQHKRSNSEGQQTPNTNTKGRVHKAGKKKAPPPPNPFGDPDAPDAPENEASESSSVAQALPKQPESSGKKSSPDKKASTTSASSSATTSPLPKRKLEGKPLPPQTPPTTLASSGQNASSNQSEESASVTTTSPTASATSTVTTTSVTLFGSGSVTTSFSSFPSISTQQTSSETTMITSTATAFATPSESLLPVVEELPLDIDEEIRQNILNDQQERQQLGLINAPPEEVVPVPLENSERPSSSTTLTTELVETPPAAMPSTSGTERGRLYAITENDIQAAQHTLEVLTNSIRSSPPQTRSAQLAQASDPSVKAKLIELKKEADTSPLLTPAPATPKTKSRPLSIGSAIYESIMGKSSSSSSNTSAVPETPASPKVPSKPWYKNLGPYKPRHQPQIRPFTSLVKFSELDKEAARIVEENKRKSAAENNFAESTQDELDELFAGISDDDSSTRPSEFYESRQKLIDSKATGSSSSSSAVKVLTSAQVHPISESKEGGRGSSTSAALPGSSSSSASTTTTTPASKNSNNGAPSTSKNDGSSSPPTFQSVHAASKHRQIKPLLTTSPITNVKSEKLAIVQPQASPKKTEVKKAGESSSAIAISSSSATATTTASSPPTTRASSPTTVTDVRVNRETNTSQINTNLATVTVTTTHTTPPINNHATSQQTETTTSTSTPLSGPPLPSPPPHSNSPTSNSEWDCARCTLKNPNWRSLCEACYYRKDPISSSSSGFMSSIFQRVNAESNKLASSSPANTKNGPEIATTATHSPSSTKSTSTSIPTASTVTTTITSVATPQPNATDSPSTASTNQPSTSNATSTSSTAPFSSSSSSSPSVKGKEASNDSLKKSDIPSPPSCENFLSQLPTKQDPSKEGKLHGIKLHEDPELEELDIGKLREARLAYFQRRQSNGSIEGNDTPETLDELFSQTNDLGAGPSAPRSSQHDNDKSHISKTQDSNANNPNAFSDNEDDFIDNILLQLDNIQAAVEDNNIPTTIENIVGSSLPHPLNTPTSYNDNNNDDPLQAQTTSVDSDSLSANAPQIPQLQNRYKPRLEAIREGSSQDYTYCYSSSDFAQIYENWQASQTTRSDNGNVVNLSNKNLQLAPTPTSTPPGLIFGSQYVPHSLSSHSQQTQQQQFPEVAPIMLQQHHHHLHEPLLQSNGGVHSIPTAAAAASISHMRGTHNLHQQHQHPIVPLMMTVDHQPYANNRLPDSPEEKYVNAMASEQHPTLSVLNTPTLNESANFSRNISPIPPLRLSPFPSVGQRPTSIHLGVSNDNINTGGAVIAQNQNLFGTQINYRLGDISTSNSGGGVGVNINSYENNMSINSSAGEGSRKLSYEDYLRMGAIPKGYSYRQNDEWSSESSGDTDSFRGFWGRRPGYMTDSLPQGMSRRSTMDFPQEMPSPVPDHTMAVGKLMTRLEAAIANGDHRLAATLAHDLALMRVNCVVAKINQPFSIRVYVEDRYMQQGPFLVQVSAMMTVRELKGKIEGDWGIPSQFQKWILGQKIAEDDNLSLASFDMAKDSMAFLFLVTPDMRETGTLSNTPSNKINVSDPTACAIASSAPAKSLPRNLGSGGGTSFGNGKCPAVVIDPVTMHAYECVDERPIYNNFDGHPPQGPSSSSVVVSKKTSTAAQTACTATQKMTVEDLRENSPPPIPSRSPIPSLQQKPLQAKPQNISVDNSNLNLTKPSNVASKPSPRLVKQDSLGKELNTKQGHQSSSSSTVDPISAASAITLSLQQKLAEFKAVAEQTFSKAGIQIQSASGIKLTKEPSPGPSTKILNTARSSSEGPSSRRNSDAKKDSNKASLKKQGKTQITPSTSKEKLSNLSNVGTGDKLAPKRVNNQERPITPENRFNGILLPTSDDDKPPERPEKLKKSLNDAQRSTSPSAPVSPATSAKGSEATQINSKKPPVPPTQRNDKEKETRVDNSSSSSSEQTKAEKVPTDSSSPPLEESSQAPQPTPRGIKRQVTSPEKIESGTHVPNSSSSQVTSENPAPIPMPRTLTTVKSDSLGATRDSQVLPSKFPTEASNDSRDQNASINEYCQTTLPFPAPKFKIAGGANVYETGFTNNLSLAPAPNSVLSEVSNKSLLRPSAFVMQMKSDSNSGNEPSNLQPSSSSSFFASSSSTSKPPQTPYFSSTSTTTTTSYPPKKNSNTQNMIAVAHVQPSTPPTAYVPPSPSTSSSRSSTSTSTSTVTAAKEEDKRKKQDDSAQSYLKMLEMMEKQDLICTMEDAECPVCFTSLPKGEGVVLRDCLHVFCRDCLVGCVQYADDSSVKCPYRDKDYACNNNLQEREIKALVPSEIFEKYLARSVKLAESKIVNTFHCKTPDCTGWCVFEDDVNLFLCPVCKKRNCLTCAAIHEGVDCLKFQRELAIAAETDEDAKQSRLMLEKMIQRGEALECPACHVVLLKKWGCDWVRCSYCKTEICWVTKGFRWGKGGKGDVSGGCKCGVNGVRCHPKCTYCH